MNALEDSSVAATSLPEISSSTLTDRRSDIEGKQTWVGELLASVGCDGLLVLEPENFAWLTAGGISRGVIEGAAQPALYLDRKSTRLNSSHIQKSRMPSSA